MNKLNNLLKTLRSVNTTKRLINDKSIVTINYLNQHLDKATIDLYSELSALFNKNKEVPFYLSADPQVKYRIKHGALFINKELNPTDLIGASFYLLNEYNGYLTGKGRGNISVLDFINNLPPEDIIYIDVSTAQMFEERITLIKGLLAMNLGDYRDKHARKDSTGLNDFIQAIISIFENTVKFEEHFPNLAYHGTFGDYGNFKPALEGYIKNDVEFTWLSIYAILEELKKHLAVLTRYNFSSVQPEGKQAKEELC